MKYKGAGVLLFIGLLLVVIILDKNDVMLTAQDDFSIQPVSSSGYILQSVIHLNNPNLLSSTIKSIREEFKLNGVVAGIIYNEINQGIPGRKESVFPISVRLGKEDYMKAVPNDSAPQSPVNIEVNGEIVFANVINGGKISIHQSATVNMAQQGNVK